MSNDRYAAFCAEEEPFDFDDLQNAMDCSIANKAEIVKAAIKIGD